MKDLITYIKESKNYPTEEEYFNTPMPELRKKYGEDILKQAIQEYETKRIEASKAKEKKYAPIYLKILENINKYGKIDKEHKETFPWYSEVKVWYIGDDKPLKIDDYDNVECCVHSFVADITEDNHSYMNNEYNLWIPWLRFHTCVDKERNIWKQLNGSELFENLDNKTQSYILDLIDNYNPNKTSNKKHLID